MQHQMNGKMAIREAPWKKMEEAMMMENTLEKGHGLPCWRGRGKGGKGECSRRKIDDASRRALEQQEGEEERGMEGGTGGGGWMKCVWAIRALICYTCPLKS